MKQHYDVLIVGGGAAGFFTAINTKEKNRNLSVCILEKGKEVLQKVKISGGGRCNLTHACFDPKELTEFYPRGKRELLGAFHQFMTGDTMEWFENRGVPLKIEADNRIFPESNSSQSIIDCFLETSKNLGITISKNTGVLSITKQEDVWKLQTKEGTYSCDKLVITAGSSKPVWKLLTELGHSIVEPVPSLFTFNIKDPLLTDLPGVAVQNVEVSIKDTKLTSTGPLLITHWGTSGPAVLKLSAFGAVLLAEKEYQYQVKVNWLSCNRQQALDILFQFKKREVKSLLEKRSPFETISKRLWSRFLEICEIDGQGKWADVSNKKLEFLADKLTATIFHAQGKSTFKDEFVTAGGIKLKEVNFKKFESKLHENLFFAGEILNIDAVTGGFNFQNAWTGGWIVSEAITQKQS
ncbi:NAD(P)/FAD-dependent oxidoreductase [Wenyingzhuangia sp. 2_MG-2023]|uniref:NAD(P)/FAD-dependent oxidoreductase n=1 Tax=Wenyingzhuangia sp. 2_MG-2023 TaxID=3062639 RepID=UPI0026E48F41|nr:NAD(P)/FAD-dependent oxidoreductase [Wenyingzhuangia sp. 2_MG-2023]MDO6738391.1 NAD(P)/FAD-dependent oxidoreductase [Wenyingzhuangia sp. 2_MG-2023]